MTIGQSFKVNKSSNFVFYFVYFGFTYNFWSAEFMETGSRRKILKIALYFYGDSIGKISELKNESGNQVLFFLPFRKIKCP